MMNFKNIHIGEMIERRVREAELELSRMTNFLNCTEQDIKAMYASKSVDSAMLLKWSKLLQYDFFRIYSQHIMLYTSSQKESTTKPDATSLPQFRKNIYTKEIIDFILDSLKSGKKTKKQVMDDYRIPKTTLYKWINKYNHEE